MTEYLTGENIAIVTSALLALSEVLSLIPAVKSNGIFQLIVNVLKSVAGKGGAAMLLIAVMAGTVAAEDAVPANGWGPSALATVGAFYLNGDYKLMQAGVAAGAAYTFGQNENVSSVGAYLGPQASQTDGKSDTSIMALIYADMFKTSAGRFGVGIGTQVWKSGDGFKGFSSSNTCLLLGYKF